MSDPEPARALAEPNRPKRAERWLAVLNTARSVRSVPSASSMTLTNLIETGCKFNREVFARACGGRVGTSTGAQLSRREAN